jgi:hypothetical protein
MVPAKKQNELLEKETEKMEALMAMLRGQIDEERAKVQAAGPRWAAAAEGPMTKFDPHGPLARKILAKRQTPKSPTSDPPARVLREAPRPKSGSSSAEPKQKGKVEIIVEPQAGKLWGNYADTAIEADGEGEGGSLWGTAPDEAEEARKFQEEIARLRGRSQSSTQGAEVEEPPLPPPGSGGALWGPPPNELEEQVKFQKEVARFRGEPQKVDSPMAEDQGVGGKIVEKKKKPPTGFTYFDKLVEKDILDGTSHLDGKS